MFFVLLCISFESRIRTKAVFRLQSNFYLVNVDAAVVVAVHGVTVFIRYFSTQLFGCFNIPFSCIIGIGTCRRTSPFFSISVIKSFRFLAEPLSPFRMALCLWIVGVFLLVLLLSCCFRSVCVFVLAWPTESMPLLLLASTGELKRIIIAYARVKPSMCLFVYGMLPHIYPFSYELYGFGKQATSFHLYGFFFFASLSHFTTSICRFWI